MILHNVEDKLDHHLDENSSSTRKRIRAESMSLIDQDGDSFNQSITSSSVLRLNLQLDEADRERYRLLLDCEDQDIFGWFMRRAEPDSDDVKRIVALVLDHARPK